MPRDACTVASPFDRFLLLPSLSIKPSKPLQNAKASTEERRGGEIKERPFTPEFYLRRLLPFSSVKSFGFIVRFRGFRCGLIRLYHPSSGIDSLFWSWRNPRVLRGGREEGKGLAFLREKTKKAFISMVDAEKRLLANALLDFSNERFVLLSESCIPVFNFPTVYKYLINSAYSFVQSYDENSNRGLQHYNSHMPPEIKLSQWRKGSRWFEIQRLLAVNIVADRKYYSFFGKYCKTSCHPDEFYIPTFLNMFHGLLNANRTVTWAGWSRGGHHPATYGRKDITESFIRSIRNNGTICTYNSKPSSVCFLFAMKFSPDALEPLLNLTSTVMKF